MKLRKFTLAVGLAALTGAGALQIDAASAGQPSFGGPDYSNTVYSIAIVSGIDITEGSREGYTGVIGAFNGDLDRSGFLYRILGSYGSYEYDTIFPGPTPVSIDGDYLQGDIMLGYQIVSNGVSAAAYIGVDYQDHDLSPDDPGNPLRGSETGFKVALDIETQRYANAPVYAALDGAYSTAFDTYYVLGRLGMNFGKVAIGPEGMLLGDASGDAQRLGAFVLFDISFSPESVGTLSLSGGYQFVDNADDPIGRNYGEEGAYGTLKFTMAFGAGRKPLK